MTTARVKVLLGVSLLTLTALLSGLFALALPGTAGAQTTPPWEPDPDAVGGLVFFNAAGQQITGGNLTDSPLAAYVEGTATVRSGDSVATLYGYLPISGDPTSEWQGEQLGESTTFPDTSAPAPLDTATLPVETGNSGDETVGQLESDYPNTGTGAYANVYQLRLYTNAPHKSQTTTYDEADILIDPTTSTWSVEYPAPSAIATTTTLSASPASPQPSGTSVTLTATVAPAAPGTVQFERGTTDIGSPVTVSAGTAKITTSTLPVGTDNLSAVYTPSTFANYSASTGKTTYTIEKTGTAPKITSAKTATLVKGVFGKFTVTATGSPAPTFSKTGALPTGVTLTKAGVLSGKAGATGTFPITITAANGVAPKATQDFTLTVVGAEITTTSPLPSATKGTAYSKTLAAEGGAKPYAWSRVTGSKALPPGLKLGATTGIISGTPTTAGTYTLNIEVTTTASGSVPQYTATKKFTLTVAS
jgi:hypothetical protein